MSQLINAKHEAFCQAYVSGPHAGNATAAFAAAGYSRIATNAARRAREPHVAKRIAELRAQRDASEHEAWQRATDALAVSKTDVMRELAKIAFSNVADYLSVDDNDALQIDLARMEYDQGAAIRHLSVDYADGPEGTRQVARVRVHMFDKRRALIDLGRELGLTFAVGAAARRAAEMEAQIAAMDDDTRMDQLGQVLAKLTKKGFDIKALIDRAVAALDGRPPPAADTVPAAPPAPRDPVDDDAALARVVEGEGEAAMRVEDSASSDCVEDAASALSVAAPASAIGVEDAASASCGDAPAPVAAPARADGCDVGQDSGMPWAVAPHDTS